MTASEELRSLLKHKGIGPEGSKSLTADQLARLTPLLNDESISLTTRATMLTAMIMLDPTDAEEEWIMSHQPFDDFLPKELIKLFTDPLSDLSALNLEVIQHEDLEEEDAKIGAQLLLDTSILDAEKAIFLEGQRLKRETFEENLGFFKVFAAQHEKVAIASEVVLFGDSFDGCQRINPYTVFSCAVLASLGVKSYVTGVEKVAPKNGITARQILDHTEFAIPKSLEEAQQDLASKGWAYIDQEVFFPAFYALREMREEMVKRPMLATFEKMLAPITGTKTHLVTAYTHKAYRTQVVELNQAMAVFDSVINIKGTEATSRPHLERASDFVKLLNGEVTEGTFEPEEFDMSTKEDVGVEELLINGGLAMKGEMNLAYASILNQCVLVLTELLQWEKAESVLKVKQALESGAALAKWK